MPYDHDHSIPFNGESPLFLASDLPLRPTRDREELSEQILTLKRVKIGQTYWIETPDRVLTLTVTTIEEKK